MFKKLDKSILYTTLIILFGGMMILFSAALPELENANFFNSIFLKQIIAILGGIIVFLILMKAQFITALNLRKYSLHIFFIASLLQILVLVPNIGLEYKGASRWIDLHFISIQPSEFFKYAVVLFFSAVVATQGKKLQKFKKFLLLGSLFTIPLSAFFIYIHDFGTLLSILFAFLVILILSANKNWHLFMVTLVAGSLISFLAYSFVPYAHTRIDNFINQDKKVENHTYQNRQMIYTIGSGQITGRGYGGSLQKYSGLIPEPLGDSIFPV